MDSSFFELAFKKQNNLMYFSEAIANWEPQM